MNYNNTQQKKFLRQNDYFIKKARLCGAKLCNTLMTTQQSRDSEVGHFAIVVILVTGGLYKEKIMSRE